MTGDEYHKNNDRQQHPPSGDHLRTGSEPHQRQKQDACNQPQVADQMVKLFVMLNPLIAGLQTTLILLGGIHFSDAQAFTSEDMFPRSEFRPEPKPNRPPRTDRMNVLEVSSGNVATFRQKSVQMPSCSRYCSTLDR